MTLLPITVYGDKILDKKATKVQKVDTSVIKLIKDMFETMKNANGIGLAANQVGSEKSIFVVDVSGVEGYEKVKPMIFINPKIVQRSKEKVWFEEGCLSLPNLRAEVERPESIKIRYQDTELKEFELEADDLLARVIQHEYDHLQGVLFVSRLPEEDKAQFIEELEKIKKRQIKADYPITPGKV